MNKPAKKASKQRNSSTKKTRPPAQKAETPKVMSAAVFKGPDPP